MLTADNKLKHYKSKPKDKIITQPFYNEFIFIILILERKVEIENEDKEEAVIFGMSLPGGYISSATSLFRECF